MKKTFASAKTFVVKNKTAVTIVAVAALTAASVALTISNKKLTNDWIAENEALEGLTNQD